MKKLIVLIIVVVIIIVLLKIMGGRVYLSSDSKENIESRIMLKYEEGKLYIKRSIYYDGKLGPDNLTYLKVRRR